MDGRKSRYYLDVLVEVDEVDVLPVLVPPVVPLVPLRFRRWRRVLVLDVPDVPDVSVWPMVLVVLVWPVRLVFCPKVRGVSEPAAKINVNSIFFIIEKTPSLV